jgi:hypothetical protein
VLGLNEMKITKIARYPVGKAAVLMLCLATTALGSDLRRKAKDRDPKGAERSEFESTAKLTLLINEPLSVWKRRYGEPVTEPDGPKYDWTVGKFKIMVRFYKEKPMLVIVDSVDESSPVTLKEATALMASIGEKDPYTDKDDPDMTSWGDINRPIYANYQGGDEGTKSLMIETAMYFREGSDSGMLSGTGGIGMRDDAAGLAQIKAAAYAEKIDWSYSDIPSEAGATDGLALAHLIKAEDGSIQQNTYELVLKARPRFKNNQEYELAFTLAFNGGTGD